MNKKQTALAASAFLLVAIAISIASNPPEAETPQPPQPAPAGAPASQLVDVVYQATPESLSALFADQPEITFVLSRKDNTLWTRAGETWQTWQGPLPASLMNVRTSTIFLHRKGQWSPRVAIVNAQDWGARGDYSIFTIKGTDDTEAIQAAIDSACGGTRAKGSPARVVYIPAGRYLLTAPLNLTTDYEKNVHTQTCIRGDGMERTVLYGSTGGLVMDFTGSAQMGLEDLSIYSYNTPNPSTVGLLFARGKKNPWAISYRVSRVDIRLHSDPSANKGIGTVAIWNYGGEHHTYTDLWAFANLPVVLTRVRQPETLPAKIDSPFIEVGEGHACSQHFTNFVGTCVLAAYDYHRPCLLANRVAEVHLVGTYMSLREGVNPAPKGTYGYAVELSNVTQYIHYGMLEGPGIPTGNKLGPGFGYMRCAIDVEDADVRVLLGTIGEPIMKEGKALTFAPVELAGEYDWRCGIHDSQINIRYPHDMSVYPEKFVQTPPSKFQNRISITNSQFLGACQNVTEPFPASILQKSSDVSWYDYHSKASVQFRD
jgi:hypothetical protein